MKILPVSLVSFKSQNKCNKYDLAYLYTAPETKSEFTLKKYKIFTAIAAVTAVTATLINVGGRRKFPYSISDISDIHKGLNKVKNNDKLVNDLKIDFIYPLKSLISGDKSTKNIKELKTGLILTGEDIQSLKFVTDALEEHINELNINTVNIPHTSIRVKDGKSIENNLKRNEINKRLLSEINKARNNFQNDGKYTVINVGNIDKLTDLKIIKSEKSRFEKLIKDLSENTNNGVIWIGWTDKQRDLPLFLNYLPILIKKVQ